VESGYLTSRALGEGVGLTKGGFNLHLCVLPLMFIIRRTVKTTAARAGMNIYVMGKTIARKM
jgi:hypothetical protein